jgi:hypothetical protein
MPMVNGKWISMDDLLEQEFGTPEQVVQDRLTGMPEEQAEWEGSPGDMHEPRPYLRRADGLDWHDDVRDR